MTRMERRANRLMDGWDVIHTCGPYQDEPDPLCPSNWDPPQDDWFGAGLHLVAASLALDGYPARRARRKLPACTPVFKKGMPF